MEPPILTPSALVTTINYLLEFKFFQELDLSPDQLDGKVDIPLKFVKFQNVQTIQIFIGSNQAGEELTQVDYLGIFGTPIATTNMKDLKKAG